MKNATSRPPADENKQVEQTCNALSSPACCCGYCYCYARPRKHLVMPRLDTRSFGFTVCSASTVWSASWITGTAYPRRSRAVQRKYCANCPTCGSPIWARTWPKPFTGFRRIATIAPALWPAPWQRPIGSKRYGRYAHASLQNSKYGASKRSTVRWHAGQSHHRKRKPHPGMRLFCVKGLRPFRRRCPTPGRTRG